MPSSALKKKQTRNQHSERPPSADTAWGPSTYGERAPPGAVARHGLGFLRLRQRGFFINDPATTEIYTLSLHDALPISGFSPLANRPRSWRSGLIIRITRPSSR